MQLIGTKEDVSLYFSKEALSLKNPITGLLVGAEKDGLLTSDLELLRVDNIKDALKKVLDLF